jgi:hypothetical protein
MKWSIKFEWIVLVALLSTFGVLGVWFTNHSAAKREALVVRAWRCSGETYVVSPLDVQPLEGAADAAGHPVQSGGLEDGLLLYPRNRFEPVSQRFDTTLDSAVAVHRCCNHV